MTASPDSALPPSLITIAVLLFLETRRYRALLKRIRSCRATQVGRGTSDEHDIFEVVQLSQMGFAGVWVWRGLDRWRQLGDGSTRRGKWLGLCLHNGSSVSQPNLTDSHLQFQPPSSSTRSPWRLSY